MKQKLKTNKNDLERIKNSPKQEIFRASKTNTLQNLFLKHLTAVKDEIRKRRMLHQLTNTKSIRNELVELKKIDDVLMTQLKP